MRRIVYCCVVLLTVFPLFAVDTVQAGIDDEARKLRPLSRLFHSLSLKERLAVYGKAMVLFTQDLAAKGAKLTDADRTYWEKTVGPLILKEGDLLSGGDATVFYTAVINDMVALQRELIALFRSAGGNVDTLVSSLKAYQDRRSVWIDGLRARAFKMKAMVEQKNVDSSKFLRIVVDSGYMQVDKEFKKATAPYMRDARVKKLLECFSFK